MRMDGDDPIGSTMECMEMVHQRHGGVCEIPPGSLHAGKHNKLVRKYRDVQIKVG